MDQTGGERPRLGGIESRVQPLKGEGWPGLDGEPGPRLGGEVCQSKAPSQQGTED